VLIGNDAEDDRRREAEARCPRFDAASIHERSELDA
jgi:hypothetical protein